MENIRAPREGERWMSENPARSKPAAISGSIARYDRRKASGVLNSAGNWYASTGRWMCCSPVAVSAPPSRRRVRTLRTTSDSSP